MTVQQQPEVDSSDEEQADLTGQVNVNNVVLPNNNDAEVTARTLRQNADIQQKVSLRLNELSGQAVELPTDSPVTVTLKGKRSGRTRTVHDIVVKELEWPHYHVQRTSAEKTLMYDDMSLPEFVAGTIKAILATETVSPLAEIQFTHLADLMTDSEDFAWPVLRQYNALVLQDLEVGRYTWYDQDIFQKKKLKHVSRSQAVAGSRRPQSSTQNTQNRPRQLYDLQNKHVSINLICKAYNTGTCNDVSPHSSPEGMVRHCCANCHKTIQRFFGHPEINCRRKTDNNFSKNQ
jgi:hypothetical protein